MNVLTCGWPIYAESRLALGDQCLPVARHITNGGTIFNDPLEMSRAEGSKSGVSWRP